MGQLSSKLRGGESFVSHWCPACEEMHVFTLHNSNGPQWKWDGNADAPTLTPSMLIRWGKKVDPSCEDEGGICHYILTAGIINFCGDSTHALSGQNVPLPDLPMILKD